MSGSKPTNYKKAGETLRRIADKVLTQNDLAKNIIIQRGSKYHAFGNYIIEEVEHGWQVTSSSFNEPLIFNTAKVALAWCIFYKTGRHGDAVQVHWLDGRVAAKQADIDALTNMLENGENLENRAVLLARLTEDISNRQSYKKQLGKCLEHAKYIKLNKGTNNELNRLNKTSRRNRGR
jgi:hypothetical protein